MCIYEHGLLTYSIEEVASFPQPYSFSLHSFHSAVSFGNKSWNFFEFPAAVPALDLAMLWPVLPSYFSRCACYQALRILCGCNFHCSGQACLLRCCDTEAEVRFFFRLFSPFMGISVAVVFSWGTFTNNMIDQFINFVIRPPRYEFVSAFLLLLTCVSVFTCAFFLVTLYCA